MPKAVPYPVVRSRTGEKPNLAAMSGPPPNTVMRVMPFGRDGEDAQPVYGVADPFGAIPGAHDDPPPF